MAYNTADQFVYVADTYNHKIKRIDVSNNTCHTCKIISDNPTNDSAEPAHNLNEPGGLCLSPTGDQLLVADTNNHRIVSIDLRTMKARPWKLDFNADTLPGEVLEANALPIIKSNRAVQVTDGVARLDLQLAFAQEADIKFTAEAPQKWTVTFSTPALTAHSATSGHVDPSSGTVQLNLAHDGSSDQQQSATVSFQLNLCSSSVCFQRRFAIEIPVVAQTANVNDAVDGGVDGHPNRIRAVLQKDSSIVKLFYDEK